MVEVTRTCPFTGQVNTLILDLDPEEFNACMAKWEAGAFIQDAFPMLSAATREFIMTGITDEVWDNVMGEDPDA